MRYILLCRFLFWKSDEVPFVETSSNHNVQRMMLQKKATQKIIPSIRLFSPQDPLAPHLVPWGNVGFVG